MNYVDFYLQEAALNMYKKLVKPEKIDGKSDKEIMAKIRRDVALSKKVYTKINGDRIYRYYDLCFVISGFRLVKIYRDTFNKPYTVSKKVKEQYMAELMEEIA